ncbi:MAG: hypothetical protein ACRCSN_18820 [Dermatophilaceae bacterium]
MSVDGTWNISFSTPMGRRDTTMSVTADGAVLTGSANILGNDTAIDEGTVDGDAMSFVVPVKRPMPMRLKFDLAVSGDELSGKVKAGPLGEQDVVGTRA